MKIIHQASTWYYTAIDYELDGCGAGAGGAVAASSKEAVGTINALGFYLMDSASYFFSEVGRVRLTGYVPTETDVLCAARAPEEHRHRQDALQHGSVQHTHVRRRRPALQ
ncbi:hypothetical protein DFH11DRAFT_1645005, partial [Phellopilus nigrolimitatus]